MRVAVDPSEVEELAWLVKDNLYTKHLILSAEELFVEFLQPDYVGGARLELEPMLSYQRMLLHRLADCFGLVHESVGEGDDRRIIIERCGESKSPLMLVSDVLESSYGEVHQAPANRQLLLRVRNGAGDQTNQPSVQSPAISLEEREAAYQAARERIFSERASVSPDTSLEQRETQRARPVPVVARRMIAHALGKPQVLTVDSPPIEISTSLEEVPADAPKEAPRHSPAKAARRMLTQALGFSVLSPSSRGLDRKASLNQQSSVSIEAGLRHCEGDTAVASVVVTNVYSKASDSDEGLRVRDAAVKNLHFAEQSSGVAVTRSVRKDRPGAAAGRMFAQALGRPPTSQTSAECAIVDGMKLTQNERKGGKKSVDVVCNAEDSVTFVDQSLPMIGSVSKAAERRVRRPKNNGGLGTNKPEVVDLRKGGDLGSKKPGVVDLRKGGGRGHKLEKQPKSRNHLFQEDDETGELFL